VKENWTHHCYCPEELVGRPDRSMLIYQNRPGICAHSPSSARIITRLFTLQSSEDSAAEKCSTEILTGPAATSKRGRPKWHYRPRNTSTLERVIHHPLPDEELSKILTSFDLHSYYKMLWGKCQLI